MSTLTSIKRAPGEKVFDIFNTVFLLILGMLTLSPFLYVVAASLSEKEALVTMRVFLWPVGLQWDNYRMIIANSTFWNSYKNSLIIVSASTTLQMLLTVLTAYPFSKNYLPGRKVFMVMVIVTLIFVPPMIPAYLVVRHLGLINTMWAMILPGAMGTFNMILCMSFFRTIPEELFEAARIDGMPEHKILFRIAIPVSMQMIVTLILFYAVGNWNAYYAAIVYVNKPSLRPLSAYLYNMVAQYSGMGMENVQEEMLVTQNTPEGIKMATIVVATLPIILVYPFIQRFFIKGVMIGSLKE